MKRIAAFWLGGERLRTLVMFSAAVLSMSGATPKNIPRNIQPAEDKIDQALQSAATAAMGQREGAIIVMDPQTGRVRAVVNPQLAFSQPLMPGSTIKSFTALAALRAELIDANSHSTCPGRFTGKSFSLPCVHADHLPPFTPAEAIAYSCNYYFATLGQRLGRDGLIETLRQFGFGEATGVADNEPTGLLRPCETGNGARLRQVKQSSQGDCDAREAIGESDHLTVTPIQLLTAYTALVNGGRVFQPGQSSANGFHVNERGRVEIAPQHRAIITEGMSGALRYGTAKNAGLNSVPLTIIGKTGTSLPAKGFRSNGWFVGFAGRSSSSADIDLAVLVLLANSHGAEAAALAKPIFETFANETDSIRRRDTEANKESATNSTIRNSQSSIKVHLVTENVTEELPLEDYVLGVMRAEGSMETEPEALKALAIAIRTYAVKNHGRHAKDGYDFCSTTHCQRFVVGAASANVGTLPDGRVSAAVRATQDQILTDDRDQPIDAYFGASCGGETANVGTLWGTNPPAYLRGVRDEYCLAGPHGNWTDAIKRDDLLRALQSDPRTNVGSHLTNLVVSKRDETGRAEFITIEGDARKQVRGWDFKIIVGRVLGWNVLKSSRFQVNRAGSNFIFHGSGFGHGLGLCQEGAHVMAARGMNYQRILEKYFPGTRVRKEDQALTALNSNNEGDPPTANNDWKADLMLPHSGKMFIAQGLKRKLQLRRSEISEKTSSHHAPTELAKLIEAVDYKHFVPPGLNTGSRLLTISSEHFRVTCPAGVDRRDADQVLNILESARGDFLHRASTASISANVPILEIRLNESTGDFTARTGQPWWAAAATKGNRIELQPFGILKRRGVLATTLRHELAHAVIDAASHDRAPRWLEEGFAIYLAGEGPSISQHTMRGAFATEELEKRLEHPRTQQEMRGLYAQAYLTVAEMIRNQGEASVWKKLAAS
jgi:SpoIID/LytB domain protein